MNIERDIMRALFARVATMAQPGQAWPQGAKVAWQNANFDPPTGMYLRAYMIYNPAARQDINSGKYHISTGILQVTVMMPEGGGDPIRDASKVIDYFPTDLILVENGVKVRVTDRPDLGPFIRGRLLPYGPHWEQPVNIRWQSMIGKT